MLMENSNYMRAKNEADRVDQKIIEELKKGNCFRVEAGAGAGKTYSLHVVIRWLQENKRVEYEQKQQIVACVTYTNAAVDVITQRLATDSFIIPSTIHSFAWNAIKQYQKSLLEIIESNKNEFGVSATDFSKPMEVAYTLGQRYVERGIHYLFHEDVLKLFCILLDKPKFRRFFTDKYPLILIDEYQDSYKPIIEKFVKHFISENSGPQFGFFGDEWQTIYQSNNACGMIENDNITIIKKTSNFRSAPKIVDLLNKIRPDLPQISAIDTFEGEVLVVTCDDYQGERRVDGQFKGEIPIDELKKRIETIKSHIKNSAPEGESLKVLMITHKVLAAQQGYSQLLEVIKEGLRDNDDLFLRFFAETVEPVYSALIKSNMPLLFETLKTRYPITKKADKTKWKELEKRLTDARGKKAIDVVSTIIDSNLIPTPENIKAYYRFYTDCPNILYNRKDIHIKDYLDLDYLQFLTAIDFLRPETVFSTEHGVKGEEYDNVVFVISKGWNQYQFDKYAPMLDGTIQIPKDKEDSFKRNRNLFYVCCSRPKKRLIIFISIKVTEDFKKFLTGCVGEDNYMSYDEYITHTSHLRMSRIPL